MLSRCREIDHSYELTSSSNPNWLLVSERLGVKTQYIQEGDEIWVRMEGLQENIPSMELVSVFFEIGLFPTWLPFCNDSKLISQISTT
jgi:hypothetical protein